MRSIRGAALGLVLCVGSWACLPSEPPGEAVEAQAAPAPGGVELDPDDGSLLRRPFTADEIRWAWVPGLTLDLRRTTPEGSSLERWTVVAADPEGVEIRAVQLGPDGTEIGEAHTERSTWLELRDHASFPAAFATREEIRRETALGSLEGWLYTVRDPASGSLSEFFFARSLPGAPVQMRVSRDGATVMELEQVGRRHGP